jgi:hypothetical protein
MITVTITEGGQFLDEIEFDDADVIACHGALTVIHRDVMQGGTGGTYQPRSSPTQTMFAGRARTAGGSARSVNLPRPQTFPGPHCVAGPDAGGRR